MALFNLRDSIKLNRDKLSNGLDIVLIPNNRVPVICVNMAYRVGSKDERFDRTGMAHLFEHLMFEGTKTVPKGEFDRLCSLAGGTNNAYTSFDLTNYYMTLPSNQLDLGLWLEADRMKNFLITEEALINQKDVVIEEINQTVEDQPYGLWRELMSATAYSSESSYSWEVHGKKEHVEAVSLKDAEIFRQMYYQPDNACLIIAGDIDFDTAFNKVKYHFSDIKEFHNNITRNDFKESHLIHKAYNVFEDDVPTPALFLAYHCKGFINDESNAADILANILGVGRSSRLWKKLVRKEQIASQAGAFIDKRENTSLLIIYAFANSPEISCNRLKENIDYVISDFIKSPISDDEMHKAINQLSSQFANEIQTLTGLADTVAQQAVFMNNPDRIFTMLDAYSKYEKD
ncbi:M16 family metallopeptidase, partial [Bacteroidota bacterium]